MPHSAFLLFLAPLLAWLNVAHGAQCVGTEPIASSYFGLHIHRFHDQRFVPKHDFATWRLWDAGVEWTKLQPERNRWDFQRLDFALQIAKMHGASVELVLGMTPSWASARPLEHSFGGPGAAAEPANIADWDQYVRQVVTRYRGRIESYEIWNEPGSTGFYTGNVATMVKLAQHAYEIIKAEDPDALVVSPSLSGPSSLPWLRNYVAAGGMRYADVVGYHFYTDSALPEAVVPLVAQVENVLNQAGLQTPLWNTESGLARSPAQSGVSISQSAHLARWLILGACSGLERFYYYAWDNLDLGLVAPDSGKEQAGASAFFKMREWMVGRQVESCDIREKYSVCKLRRGDQVSYVAWGDGSTRLSQVGISNHAEDLYGFSSDSPNPQWGLSASPVWGY